MLLSAFGKDIGDRGILGPANPGVGIKELPAKAPCKTPPDRALADPGHPNQADAPGQDICFGQDSPPEGAGMGPECTWWMWLIKDA